MADRITEAANRKRIEQVHLRIALQNERAGCAVMPPHRYIGQHEGGIGYRHLAGAVSTDSRGIVRGEELAPHNESRARTSAQAAAIITDMKLAQRKHRPATHSEQPISDVADLEPIICGPGHNHQ